MINKHELVFFFQTNVIISIMFYVTPVFMAITCIHKTKLIMEIISVKNVDTNVKAD